VLNYFTSYLLGKVLTERNGPLLVNCGLYNDHYDTMLPVQKRKESSGIFDEVRRF
jgi:hypothetical protein